MTKEFDTLYKLVASFRYETGFEVNVYEYPIVKETAKSYMDADGGRYPKEDIDLPKLDTWNGHFFKGTLIAYETTREEVDEHYVPMLRDAVKKWFTEKRDYYDRYVQQIERAVK